MRPGLLIHPKFRRLCALLKISRPEALGYLSLLWETGYEHGDIVGDDTDVAAAAEWPGDAVAFTQALADAGGADRHGFIEPLEDDATEGQAPIWKIHDLYHHAPPYVQRRMRRELARQAEGTTISELRADAARKRRNVKQLSKRSVSDGHLQTSRMQKSQLTSPSPSPSPSSSKPAGQDDREPQVPGADRGSDDDVLEVAGATGERLLRAEGVTASVAATLANTHTMAQLQTAIDSAGELGRQGKLRGSRPAYIVSHLRKKFDAVISPETRKRQANSELARKLKAKQERDEQQRAEERRRQEAEAMTPEEKRRAAAEFKARRAAGVATEAT